MKPPPDTSARPSGPFRPKPLMCECAAVRFSRELLFTSLTGTVVAMAAVAMYYAASRAMSSTGSIKRKATAPDAVWRGEMLGLWCGGRVWSGCSLRFCDVWGALPAHLGQARANQRQLTQSGGRPPWSSALGHPPRHSTPPPLPAHSSEAALDLALPAGLPTAIDVDASPRSHLLPSHVVRHPSLPSAGRRGTCHRSSPAHHPISGVGSRTTHSMSAGDVNSELPKRSTVRLTIPRHLHYRSPCHRRA